MNTSSDNENDLHRSVLKSNISKTPRERGFVPGKLVRLYVWNSRTNDEMLVGVAKVCADSEQPETYQTTLHGHRIAANMVVLSNLTLVSNDNPDVTEHAYPYEFNSMDDLPQTLAALKGLYFTWDARAMLTLRPGTSENPETATTEKVQEVVEVDSDDEFVPPVDNLETGDVDNDGDQAGVSFQPKKLSMKDYKLTTVRAKISQIREFEHPLRPIDETHSNDLRNKFLDLNVGYQESAGLMSATLLEPDFKDGKEIHACLVFDKDSSSYRLKEDQTITIVDGRHRRKAILEIAAMEGERLDWSRGYLTISLISRVDGKLLCDWEVLMKSSQKNESSSLVKLSTTVVDLMTRVISYSKIFQKTYGVGYLEAKNSSILADMHSSRFLSGTANSTYKKYIRLSKVLLRNNKVLDYIFNHSKIAEAKHGRRTNISYFTDSRLISAEEDDMLFMLKCADSFFVSDSKNVFHAKPFYEACELFLTSMKTYYQRIECLPQEKSETDYPKTFSAFKNGLFFISKAIQTTPEEAIINNMTAFKYTEGDKGITSTRIVKAAVTRMIRRLDDRYYPSNQSGGVAGKSDGRTGMNSTLGRRTRRSSGTPSVIDLTERMGPPAAKKQRRPRSGTGGSVNKKSGYKQYTTPTPKKSTRSALRGAAADDEYKEQGPFDDAFDPARPPTNWEAQHAASLRMKDVTPSSEFLTNVRNLVSLRETEVEDNWDRDNRVKSSNPRTWRMEWSM